MTKRKMYGSAFVKRLETLGRLCAGARAEADMMESILAKRSAGLDRRGARENMRDARREVDALTFALDVINDAVPDEAAYEEWGSKLMSLHLHHSETADGKPLVYATVEDYYACETPPHDNKVHVMRMDTAQPLGTHEPRTADNAYWIDMIAGLECGHFFRIDPIGQAADGDVVTEADILIACAVAARDALDTVRQLTGGAWGECERQHVTNIIDAVDALTGKAGADHV